MAVNILALGERRPDTFKDGCFFKGETALVTLLLSKNTLTKINFGGEKVYFSSQFIERIQSIHVREGSPGIQEVQ